MTETVQAQSTETEEDRQSARHQLFGSVPLGWNMETIRSLYSSALSLPGKAPESISYVKEQRRTFGVVGSLILMVFLAVLLYSVIWRKRVILKLEKELQPLLNKVPEETHPHLLSFIRIIVSPLLPLLLLGTSLLINGAIHHDVPWLAFITKLWDCGPAGHWQ